MKGGSTDEEEGGGRAPFGCIEKHHPSICWNLCVCVCEHVCAHQPKSGSCGRVLNQRKCLGVINFKHVRHNLIDIVACNLMGN